MLLNDMAALKLTRLVLDGMKQTEHGWILNVSSIAAYMPGPYNAVYHASKSFLTSWSYALRYELKSYNITVSQLAPGPVFETALGIRARMYDALGFGFTPGMCR